MRPIIALVLFLPLSGGCKKYPPEILVAQIASGLEVLDIDGAEGPWAPDPQEKALLPLGVWLRVNDIVAYSYLDPQQGPGVRWDTEPVLCQNQIDAICRLLRAPGRGRASFQHREQGPSREIYRGNP